MKNKCLLLLITWLGSLFISLDLFADHHGENKVISEGDDRETLFVEYNEQVFDIYAERYNGFFNEPDRFHYFVKNFEKAFEKEDWPLKLKFARYPIKTPEGANVLQMNFLSFRSANPIEIELRMWAKLKDGSETHDFGVQLVRLSPNPVLSVSTIDRDLDKLYTKMAAKVVKELNEAKFAGE